MKFTCLIVDDVALNREMLKDLVLETSYFSLAGSCNNATEASNVIGEKLPDVLFLDIEMPGMTGLDFIKTLVKRPLIVITTSYKEFAAEGFDLDVFDYIVKPVTRQRFTKCCNKIVNHFKEQKSATNEQLFLRTDGNFVRVKFDEILYIQAMEDFVVFYTEQKKIITRMSMRECSALLPQERFIRVHRSFIVAINKIDVIGKGGLRIQKNEIPLGPQYRAGLMQLLLK